MMEKHFISANALLIDSYKLAEQIYTSDCRPDFIVALWRGGTPTGIAVQEYFDYMGVHTDHIAIRTSYYSGIDQVKEIRIHGLDYIIDHISQDHELLIVDDVFDSGRSLQSVIERLREKCRRNMPDKVRIACPWYKPQRNVTDIKPDFYIHETDKWLVFPHELTGLTLAEITEGKDPEVADMIARVLKSKEA